MQNLTLIQQLAVWVLPVLFAITVHEVAHGWVANHYGDPTARMMGRLTLNPVKHIDPVGTILVPGLMLMMGGIVFGWAKPVPVNHENLRDPRRHMMLVAVAGPGANLAMAVLWALVIWLGVAVTGANPSVGYGIQYMGLAGVTINIVLMVLNMLPVPPLDGSRVVSGLLPPKMSWQYNRIEPYGLIIVLVLLFTGILFNVLTPIVNVFRTAILTMTGLM